MTDKSGKNLHERIKRVQETSKQSRQTSQHKKNKSTHQNSNVHEKDAQQQMEKGSEMQDVHDGKEATRSRTTEPVTENENSVVEEEQAHPHERNVTMENVNPVAIEQPTDSSNRDVPMEKTNASQEEQPKRPSKVLKIFGSVALALGIGVFFFTGSPTVDTSESAENALANQSSTEISAGVVLLADDEELAAQDHTITHNSDAEETKIWIWDYAAEDGDYVQVLVNGTPVTDSFMIKHKPREITVPTVGTVEIKGIRDGGGGITYAVRYDVNGTSYFNSAPIGGENTYELIRE